MRDVQGIFQITISPAILEYNVRVLALAALKDDSKRVSNTSEPTTQKALRGVRVEPGVTRRGGRHMCNRGALLL